MERNPDGFRISDVRPDTGWAFLHWDDSNLPASDFTPQTELDGVLSNTGVHDWGASSDAGNNRLVNTWSFGQLAIDSFPLILSYNCDYDGDGITNSVDLDDDNDGITDSLEHGGVLPVGDHDGDTIGNFQDADYVHPLYGAFRDSNGDGVNDLFDADGDGIPNFRDVDSDGDGLLDAFEANGGVSPAALNDSTGRITGAVGANGLPDAIETGSESGVSTYALTDTDSDNRPDFRDQDSDNDGLRDNIEVYATGAHVAPSGNDTDGDAYPDWHEGFDDNGNGYSYDDYLARASAYESSQGNPGKYPETDLDLNGTIDWLDSTACPSIPNFLCQGSGWFHDSDADGWIDLFDPDDGGSPSSLPDFDGVNGVDFRDNGTGIPLPVKLLGFAAALQEGEGILLHWDVESEFQLDAYRLSRIQKDGRPSFLIQIASTESNTNVPKRYAWLDRQPESGPNVYLLQPINSDGSIDGQYYTSATWTTPDVDWQVWPSPFRDHLILSGYTDTQWSILHAGSGQQHKVRTSSDRHRLETGTWPSGVYLICPQSADRSACRRVVKARP